MNIHNYDFKKILFFLGGFINVILAISATATGIYFYQKYKNVENRLQQTGSMNQQEVETLVARVGKLIKLPEGELPTIATVSELEGLKTQPFFAQAQIGDKVLLYTLAKKAILYNPTENLVVEVGPLMIPTITPNDQFSKPPNVTVSNEDVVNTRLISPTPNETQLKIALYNSTTSESLVNTFEAKLTQKFKNAEVVLKSNTIKRGYENTLVIDVSNTRKSEAESIANSLNLNVGQLPNNEKAPENIDLLIIIGNDQLPS